jgi:hypothetical protein
MKRKGNSLFYHNGILKGHMSLKREFEGGALIFNPSEIPLSRHTGFFAAFDK